MLVSQILFYAYGAFSPSPQRPRERSDTVAMKTFVDTKRSIVLDPEFVAALQGMKLELEKGAADRTEIVENLRRLNLEKHRIAEELATAKKKVSELTETCGLKDAKVSAVEDQVKDLTQQLSQVNIQCQNLTSTHDRVSESLERHKKEEDRLVSELEARKQELKKSKILARVATRQSALDIVTTEMFVDDARGFVQQIKAIIEVYKGNSTDCRLLERTVDAFEKNSDFVELSESIQEDYSTGNADTVALVDKKKEKVRELLVQMAEQIN
jgi:chromosome segregation ATPase